MTLKAIATESLSASGITIGTSVITGGTDKRVLFDDAGVVGEAVGLTYAKATQSTSVVGGSLGAGATANFLSVTGTWNDAGTVFNPALLLNVTNTASTTTGTNIFDAQVGGVSKFKIRVDGFIQIPNISLSGTSGNITSLSYTLTGGGVLTISSALLTGPATGVLQHGAADAAVAVAQTLRVQSVVAGTAAANGANWTFIGSLPTGTGTSGDIIIQTGVKTGSGTTQGTATTALTIKGETQAITIASGKSLVLGNSASTGLAAGVLAALTNASLVITDASGQAYRIPCII